MAHRDSPKMQGILKIDEPSSPSGLLTANQALSPRATPKSVSIAPHVETISPLLLGSHKDVDEFELERVPSGPRQHVAKGPGSKRLSGRRSHNTSMSSLQSVVEPGNGQLDDDDSRPGSSDHHHHHHLTSALINQVTAWVREEKSRSAARKAKRKAKSAARRVKTTDGSDGGTIEPSPSSTSSDDESVDLSRLEEILERSLSIDRPPKPRSAHSHRRRPSVKSLHKSSSAGAAGASSDTDYYDGDILVPSAEAWLDNTKTLAYSGGAASTDDLSNLESSKTNQAWATFKYEIVRLTHTLRLKGWRRVPMEMSSDVGVDRLSGALTNAVYVVSPPSNLPSQQTEDDKPRRPQPPKLLLRIYGPQVEHLIDREAELQILRRLARKRIGPRMLGTFSNGRFEEFFHARTLTPNDLRNPDTSKHIAKRMRELHEGVSLLERERDDGPFVWRNWDKWVQRVGDVASWLDKEVLQASSEQVNGSGKTRELVCGTEWSMFKNTLEKYREWLEEQYAEPGQLRRRLVFAHNDTQYGNILRLLPAGASPLLLPANSHKQLVVIDFEYASANTPGLEFANHFTEWCYNYHDPALAWHCNTKAYPNPEEQDRFIRAYVRHRPQFNVSTPQLGPLHLPVHQSTEHLPSSSSASSSTVKRPAGPTSSISNFMLDARAPANSADSLQQQLQHHEDEKAAAAAEDAEVATLLRETRLWRLANTAQWVAWGIVQAKVPGLPDFGPPPASASASASAAETNEEAEQSTPTMPVPRIANAGVSASPEEMGTPAEQEGAQAEGEDATASDFKAELEDMRRDIDAKRPDPAEEDDGEAEEEFDYLRYARDRAMFFWGDAVKLGLVKAEELPEDVRDEMKTVDDC